MAIRLSEEGRKRQEIKIPEGMGSSACLPRDHLQARGGTEPERLPKMLYHFRIPARERIRA